VGDYMKDEDIKTFIIASMIFTIIMIGLLALKTRFESKEDVIKIYQECLQAGATVEYCESNL
jgi:hypothetical protein